ncbi:hypothetical protein RVS70_05395 [Virgibacillus sp. M23]|uniref:hypothetical protein n=1 Tax=Virgibacillus sp. M23 TaxID=3079030 RepID=UPI002A917961|nr:hypothetical protein [Virgibacillus sp. M23]MDY7043636.1 hypothetical protein [Virgibacillus sp. M23]
MKLIDNVIVNYKEHKSDDRIEDIDKLIEENRFNDDGFDYYFEVHEEDDFVVFANVAGYELLQEDIDSGCGRVFQVETALLVKKENIIYYLENDGFKSLNFLKNYPVWTSGKLRKAGVKGFQDAGINFPYRNFYWKDYVN